ncbi:MAG: GNAT family N-acetyltransferase [Patescibacteria group bacterium]|nr:GNAT family N-acetyltransferase [Patescibacteria group bacterium]
MIKIIYATIEDYDDFLDVFKEIEEYHRVNASWKFQKPKPELFPRDYFHKVIEDENGIFFLAKDNTKIVGYLTAFEEKSPDRSMLKLRKYIQIDDLSVRSDYRKKGIGTLLMDKLEELAKKNKIYEVELNVWCFNKGAIKFYENKGYESFTQKMRKVLK